MPEKSDSKTELLYDKRVAQRYIKKGLLDQKDYDKAMKSLPDLADQATPIESEMEVGVTER